MEAQSPSLKIYKSSAGSGKTYQLVLNYLSLILRSEKPDKFKRILAITFTNKASKEMKERVLQGLSRLKEGKDHSFVNDYVKSTGLPAHELAERASILLTNILHSYGHLNILTIDKFVHRIIRSFSRELGLTTNFELTFDFDTITARCIDEVLQELGNDNQLTTILVDYYKQLIDQEDNPNIEKALNDKAKILNQEDAIKKLSYYKDKDLSFFTNVQKDIREKVKSKRESAIKHIQLIKNILGNELPNLKNGSTKAFGSILEGWDHQKTGEIFSPSQLKKVQNNEWLSSSGEKKHPELTAILAENGSDLRESFLLINDAIHEISFLKKLDKNMMSFALLNNVQQQVEQLKTDNNLVLIGELNKIISEIIGKESAPYIYEKIGARFENYFVDEFQDTSELQWKNLIPLIHESLSSGHTSLIVGDAKQSIYRWRGGNAQQFIDLPVINFEMANGQDIKQSFSNSHEGYILKDNFRSSNSVIKFNNWIFPNLIESINSPLLTEVYKDIKQNTKRTEEGYVEITLYKPKTEYNKECPYDENLRQQINDCLADGYHYKDLCVLVRKNKEGAEIAQFLSKNGFPVTSLDSLLLSDSKEVLLIYAFLKALFRPTDENILRLFTHFKSKSLLSLFEQYRIPAESNEFYSQGYNFDSFLEAETNGFDRNYFSELGIFDQVDYLIYLLLISREDLYIDKLMNVTYDFQQKNGHQTGRFIEYLEEKVLKSSVVPPDSINAITIMTIHKSKGLQFPVVFIPKRIEEDNRDDLWLSNKMMTDLGLSEINMNPGKDFPDESIQQTKKIQEEQSNLDLLNLIYVAYTRAENRLYIHLEEYYASQIVKNQIALIETHPEFNKDSAKLILGKHQKFISKEKVTRPEQLILDSSKTQNWRETLILATPKSIIDADNSFSERNWGIVLHEILQTIDTPNDWTASVNKYLKKHKEWEGFRTEIESVLSQFGDSQDIQSLYSNIISTLSERNLATANGEILRPDKVFEKENEIIVIDFKTGSALPKHEQQILKYGNVLKKIYHKPIKLYLVYLSPDKLTVVHV